MRLIIESASRRSTEFCVEHNSDDAKASLSGTFRKEDPFLILEGKLSGDVKVVCGVTCQPFFAQIQEELFVKFVSGEFKGFDPKYDVIETNGEIDLDKFLLEELESFRLDYHIAPGIEFSEANL